jgi:hypothetical protein
MLLLNAFASGNRSSFMKEDSLACSCRMVLYQHHLQAQLLATQSHVLAFYLRLLRLSDLKGPGPPACEALR